MGGPNEVYLNESRGCVELRFCKDVARRELHLRIPGRHKSALLAPLLGLWVLSCAGESDPPSRALLRPRMFARQPKLLYSARR